MGDIRIVSPIVILISFFRIFTCFFTQNITFFRQNAKKSKKIKKIQLFSKNLLTNQNKRDIIVELTNQWPVGQAAKTSASHAENMGSIPVPVTRKETDTLNGCLFLFLCSAQNRTHLRDIYFSEFTVFSRARGSKHCPPSRQARPCKAGKFPYINVNSSHSIQKADG